MAQSCTDLETLLEAVREDPHLTPEEKETTITFAKPNDRALVHTEEAGLIRRLLQHPAFDTAELRVTVDGAWSERVPLHAFSGGP